MNEFKKIVPKKKEKKRASSAKRNNYLTEKKKLKSLPIQKGRLQHMKKYLKN